ncbi:MAG: hypothetical protein OXD42_13305 [Rhodospirillaceae bacterium]|nr:hypothetical protein [Rhodospirillaceae bacterium]
MKPGDHGRILRIGLDSHDRRIFTPTPWGNPSWRRSYNRRTATERINSRLDNSFNFETHYIRGRARVKTRIGLAPRADALPGQRRALPRHRLTPSSARQRRSAAPPTGGGKDTPEYPIMFR